MSFGLGAQELTLNQFVARTLQQGLAHNPSLREIEDADGVLVLGEDVTQTAPRVALALRQAAKRACCSWPPRKKVPTWNAAPLKNIAQRDLSPVFITSIGATRLDDIAAATYRASPSEQAQLGFAVAHAIDASAPAVAGLGPHSLELAKQIADGLLAAEKPLVVSGTALLDEGLLQAAVNVALALKARGKTPACLLSLREITASAAPY